jgi:hypothetical protein
MAVHVKILLHIHVSADVHVHHFFDVLTFNAVPVHSDLQTCVLGAILVCYSTCGGLSMQF